MPYHGKAPKTVPNKPAKTTGKKCDYVVLYTVDGVVNNGSLNIHSGGSIYGTTIEEDWSFNNRENRYY